MNDGKDKKKSFATVARRRFLTGFAAGTALMFFTRGQDRGTSPDHWREFVDSQTDTDPEKFGEIEKSLNAKGVPDLLRKAMAHYKDELARYLQSDDRPVSQYMLLLTMVHQHIQQGEPLNKLPKDVQDFLVAYAKTIPFRDDVNTSNGIHHLRIEGRGDDNPMTGSYIVFVSGGAVGAVGTHDNFKPRKAAPGDLIPKYNSAGTLGPINMPLTKEFLLGFAQERAGGNRGIQVQRR